MQSVVHAEYRSMVRSAHKYRGKSPRTFERQSAYSLETLIYNRNKRKISKQLAKAGSTLGEIVGNRNIFRCTTESNVATDAWILIWHFEMLDGVFGKE